MTLRDGLTDIRGIGDAKADEIMAVIDDHSTESVPEELRENLITAYEYQQEGVSPPDKFLERAVEVLD